MKIDYEGGSSVYSNRADYGKSAFFVNGDFFNGKVRDIEVPKYCYNIKFNLDSTILAIGLNDDGGVLLYETQTFEKIATIDRDDSVSALDWVDNPYHDADDVSLRTQDNSRSQLLAVSGFDGVVSIYAISLGSSTKNLVKTLYDERVKSDVLSMAFIKDTATNYAPYPLALAIGQKNGTVSIFLTDGETNQFKSSSKMTDILQHETEVLAMAFGFVEDGIIFATGTKEGLIRVYSIGFHQGQWQIYDLMFQFYRTGAIRALRFNHDSTLLIVGGYDKTVLLVDTFLWKVVREILVDGTVSRNFFPMIFIAFEPLDLHLSRAYRCVRLSMIHFIGICYWELDQKC